MVHGFRWLALILAAGLCFGGRSVQAQTPPTDAERAAYTGLLAVTSNRAHNEIRQLIVNGVPLEAKDRSDRTAYLVAAYNADPVAMELLAKAGADTRAKDNRNYDAITILAVSNHPDMMQKAIDLGGDPRAITSPYLGTALIAAAHLGHVEVVRRLIKAGAPLDHVNNLGWTALIESIVLGDGGANHTQVLKDLLDAGANPNLPDRNGASPVQLAEGRGHAHMAALLRAKGGR
jgi:uncharacterized protein